MPIKPGTERLRKMARECLEEETECIFGCSCEACIKRMADFAEKVVLPKDETIERQGDKIDEQALQLAALEKRIAKADELIVALLYHRKHGGKASHKRVFELVNEYEAIRCEFGLADGREEKRG